VLCCFGQPLLLQGFVELLLYVYSSKLQNWVELNVKRMMCRRCEKVGAIRASLSVTSFAWVLYIGRQRETFEGRVEIRKQCNAKVSCLYCWPYCCWELQAT